MMDLFGKLPSIMALLWWIIFALVVTESSTTENLNLQRLSRAHLEFALSLFREMTENASPLDNVVVSPYSVASVLSQLWLGAGEDSNVSKAFINILHYEDVGLNFQQVHKAFKSLLETLNDPDYQNVVQTANAIFVQAGVPILKSYESQLREFYNSSMDEVDFENGESLARSIINRWVSKQTKERIPKLLENSLPSHTRLLLVNALALSALWKNSFDPLMTASDGVFYPSPETRIKLPMMAGKFHVLLGTSEELNCRLLELPFRGRRLSMFIILPEEEESPIDATKTVSSLQRLEKSLNADNLKRLFSTLREESVQIRLPKFKITQTVSLEETLSHMGLESVFQDSTTSFSKISNDTNLHVSSIAHKVVLEVSEKGAKAAAATATLIERLGSFSEQFFEVDHPFIFFIWDYHSGALLFIGRVAYPELLQT